MNDICSHYVTRLALGTQSLYLGFLSAGIRDTHYHAYLNVSRWHYHVQASMCLDDKIKRTN